jgi:hypothetical protein
MKIIKKDLSDAVDNKIISHNQADDLWGYFESENLNTPLFNFTNLLYYFGGFLAIGAMTLFMNMGWHSFGGFGIFWISLFYFIMGIKVTDLLINRSLAIPAGITSAFCVAITPLAIFGLQIGFGLFPENKEYHDYYKYVEWRWIYMELGALLMGSILTYKYKLPFLLMPVAVTLWFLSMDLTDMIMHSSDYNFELKQKITAVFGALMVLLAFTVDSKTKSEKDFAYWLYIFGAITLAAGMTLMKSESEISNLIYFCFNLLLMFIGISLVRGIFVIFGSLGSIYYIGHLSHRLFDDSALFPLILTITGGFIIYLGVLWQRHKSKVLNKLHNKLPFNIQEIRNKRL